MKKKKQSRSLLISETQDTFFRDLPALTLYGTSLAEIDNFKALLDFSHESLGLATSGGIIRINGNALEITILTDDSVSVKGEIKNIEFD